MFHFKLVIASSLGITGHYFKLQNISDIQGQIDCNSLFFLFLNGNGLENLDIILDWGIRVMYLFLVIPHACPVLPSHSFPDFLLALCTSLPIWDHPCNSVQKNYLAAKKKV